jgi:transcriptional regulator with XRE-family HTH domain
MDAGELIKRTRIRHGISQYSLAVRAGTHQAVVSRIERGKMQPTVASVERLLAAMGERLVLSAERIPGDHDPVHRRELLSRSPEERLELAVSWNRLAEGLSELVGGLAPTESLSESLDPRRIFEEFVRHEVDFVLVGGLAAQTHGNTRMTSDVGVIPAPDPDNLARLAEALNALNARVLNAGHEEDGIDAAMLPRTTIWQFATPHGDIDVLHEAPGAAPFPELRERALVIALANVSIPVVGLDDLIRMKLARGRPVDMADVAALTDSAEPSA